jgi:hypothetical protein
MEDKLWQAAHAAAMQSRAEFKDKEGDKNMNWREHKLVSEIYHQMRHNGTPFEELTIEDPKVVNNRKTRKHFDLVWRPASAPDTYVQVIIYKNALQEKQLNDLEAFQEEKSPAEERIVILVRYGDEPKYNVWSKQLRNRCAVMGIKLWEFPSDDGEDEHGRRSFGSSVRVVQGRPYGRAVLGADDSGSGMGQEPKTALYRQHGQGW